MPLKWTAATICTAGIALTSFNVYPLNIILTATGTLLWVMAGILTRDWPLAIGDGIHLVLYVSGLIYLVFEWI